MTERELNRVRELNKKIRTLERFLAELRLSAENIVPILDGLPKAALAKSRVEKIALRAVESGHELETLRNELIQAKTELADKIMAGMFEPVIQTLLMLRYVEGASFNQTARRMRISLRHVFRLHEKFLKCHIAAQNHS